MVDIVLLTEAYCQSEIVVDCRNDIVERDVLYDERVSDLWLSYLSLQRLHILILVHQLDKRRIIYLLQYAEALWIAVYVACKINDIVAYHLEYALAVALQKIDGVDA